MDVRSDISFTAEAEERSAGATLVAGMRCISTAQAKMLNLNPPTNSVHVRSMHTSAEQDRSDHNASYSEQGGDHSEDRECQEEGEHDQDRSHADENSGHGITVRQIQSFPTIRVGFPHRRVSNTCPRGLPPIGDGRPEIRGSRM